MHKIELKYVRFIGLKENVKFQYVYTSTFIRLQYYLEKISGYFKYKMSKYLTIGNNLT